MHLRALHRHIIIDIAGVLPAPSCFGRGAMRQCCKMADSAFLGSKFRGTAREGAAGMAARATRASAAAENLLVVETPVVETTAVQTTVAEGPIMGTAAVLGSLTIPGRPEHVREARAFVAKALGDLHPGLADAVLLTSELVTNAVMHSGSHCPGGTITVQVTESAGGVRVE